MFDQGHCISCAIVTDTTASLPAGYADEHGIQVVSQIILFGKESYEEERTITRQQFIERLISSAEPPKTAAPEPRALVEAYQRAFQRADTVLSLHPSVFVSGTVRSAELARANSFPEADIRIIDTHSIASGLGSIVQEAVACSEHGLPPDEIVARVESLCRRCRIYFLVPSLEFLQRGGRIGRASALMGTLLQVKPILTFAEGQVAPYEKVRTYPRAVERMVELVAEQCPHDETAWLSVLHGDNATEAAALAARVGQVSGQSHVPVLPLGASITTHAGPGVLGVSFFTDDR